MIGTMVAHRQLSRYAPDRDPYIFPLLSLLSGWGLLAIWRLDSGLGRGKYLAGYWFARHLRRAACTRFARFATPVQICLADQWVLLTGLTFLFAPILGRRASIMVGCCGVYLQPSEPLKLLLIVYGRLLADHLPLTFSLPNSDPHPDHDRRSVNHVGHPARPGHNNTVYFNLYSRHLPGLPTQTDVSVQPVGAAWSRILGLPGI